MTTTLIDRLHHEGILRRGSKTAGFQYAAARGRPPSADELRRIRSLALPPAWKEVAIARGPGARLQAVGKDKAGRWQYRYHPLVTREREQKKLERLLAFADALPRLRRRVERDLRLPGLQHDRVMACLARILQLCFLRPGSERYATESGHYGLCTLKSRHVSVRGDVTRFDFVGKSGKRQVRELRDRRVANVIRALLKLPGERVFQEVGPDGAASRVRRRDVNAYIKQVMGAAFTAKDFRTWSGTLLCACALARAEVPPDAPAAVRKKLVRDAIAETAAHLGNTPAICKASYVSPAVLAHFDQGRVVAHHLGSVDELATASPQQARRCENALVALLRDEVRERPRRDLRPKLTRLGRALVAGESTLGRAQQAH